MKYRDTLRYSMTTLLMLFVVNSFAGTNPVAWSVQPTSGFFPASTPIGTSSWAVYTLTNNLPLPATLMTSFDEQGGVFNIYQNCNQHSIAPKASCYIIIEFAPTTAGRSSIALTYGYHNNRIPLPAITVTSTGTPPPTSGIITGSITTIPPFSLNNPTQTPVFTVTYHNSSPEPVVVTGYAGDINGHNLLTSSPTSVATIEIITSGQLASNCGTSNSPILLSQGQSCHISGQLTPHATGQLTVSGLFTYNAGTNTSTPSTGTLVTSGGTGSCPVTQAGNSASTGSALYLPTTTYQYTDNVVKFVLTNTSTDQGATLGPVSFASNVSPSTGVTITPSITYDTCSNQTIGPQDSCYVMASIIPTVTTSGLIIRAEASCNTGTVIAVTPSASVTNFSGNTQSHNVVFVNQCPFPVWYEFANNSTTGGADPTPSGGSYQVNAPVNGVPAPVTLSVSEYLNGGLYVRTGCNTTTGACATGTCGSISSSDPMRCAVGVQPPNNLPLTKMEMTLEPYSSSPTSDGVYDVSMVNGFNLPAEVRSLAPASSSNLFGCGQSAGAIIQPPSGEGLGNCPWTFTPPNTGAPYITANFVSVTNPTPSSCTSTPPTSDGTCGVGYNSNPMINSMNQGYSTFLGYWNIFSYVNPGAWGNVDLYTAFTLGASLSSISGQDYGTYASVSATFADMWGCLVTSNNSLRSGYSTNTGSGLVCGCYQWNLPGSSVPTADGTCNINNSDWESVVYPYILWFKQACPTAYSWNHDDPSSSFTCNNNSATALTNYQITYCPGGQTGLQPGAPDGRNIVPS